MLFLERLKMISDEETNRSLRLDEYLTVAEAAGYVGVSPSTLRNWDRTGKLTAACHPVNGYRLYKREELDRVLSRIRRMDRK